jgi:hypothetical protein
MGKERAELPSVEARVVETKQKFAGSLENILFTLFTFLLLCFHFSLFCSSSSFFVVFYFYFTPTLFSFGVRFFRSEGGRSANYVWGQITGPSLRFHFRRFPRIIKP